jgi:8-amino-3,8-dideoxy-alpha-D-manno-octulosonate transaminase
MDPGDLEKKITSKSTVIMPVHMSGAPGRLDEILQIAKQKNLKALCDCAQANGASFKGKPIGELGDVAIFSLQLNKNMTTGEGGVVVCDDEHLYKRAFAAHDLGYARNQEGRLTTEDTKYQMWGQGCRVSELTAAIGRVQLRKLPKIVANMRTAKYKIREALADVKQLRFRTIVDPAGDSSSFLITIFPESDICKRFIEALRAEGIVPPPVGISNVPLTEWGLHIYYNNTALVNKASISADGRPWTHPANIDSDYSYGKGALPQADDLIGRSSILGIPSVLTDDDVDDIVRAYHKVATHVLQ